MRGDKRPKRIKVMADSSFLPSFSLVPGLEGNGKVYLRSVPTVIFRGGRRVLLWAGNGELGSEGLDGRGDGRCLQCSVEVRQRKHFVH